MASSNICESCFSNGKSTKPVKMCSDCDERLCEQCSVYHLGFKAFQSHHLISLAVVPRSELRNVKKNCEHHVDGLLDFYCTSHDTLCCRSCIPETHQSCKTVLPLEKASSNVRNSSLFTETQNELTSILETLNKLLQLKDDNLKRLENSSSVILEQVQYIKRQLVEKINEIEQNLIESLKQTKIDVESNIESTKAAILDEVSKAENIRQEIRFLEEHGTNNQLFVALKTNENSIKTLENITAMLTRNPDIDIKFKPVTLSIKSLGSISQPTTPCDIQYTPSRYKQAQTKSDINRTLTKFKQDGEVVLKRREDYYLTDIAVTPDNKLILCNSSTKSPKVFTYTDCNRYENQLTFSSPPNRIALIPNTNRAVVTIWDIKSIQFFNYETMTKEHAIQTKGTPCGIAALSDKLFIGGDNVVNMVDYNGTHLKTISMSKKGRLTFIKVISPNNILCRSLNFVHCINSDGDALYKYKETNYSGIAVDRGGNVYVGGFYSNDICKLSPELTFVDTVLKRNDGLVYPFSMTFNNEFDKLYVINNEFKAVAIYTCS